MNILRRRLLKGMGSAAALGVTPWHQIRAQSSTSRPVRIVVGFPPGGPQDIVARALATSLATRTARSWIVENRAGASGNIAAETVVRAAPDGETLLLCGPVNAINAALFDKLPFDFATDVVAVAGIARVPLVLLVHPEVPARDAAELVSYAKTRPEPLALASAGNGTPQHVTGALFALRAAVALTHVPYRGSAPALTDLVGGQVQAMFDALPSALPHLRTGRLRALAVTTAQRSALLPDVPCLMEMLPGFEASSWYGLAAPAATPDRTVQQLNSTINEALSDPALEARLAQMGGESMAGPSSDLAALIRQETAKWREVIGLARIRAD